MSEKNEESGWFSSMLGTVTESLDGMLSGVREDLSEFVETIQHDTQKELESTVSAINDQKSQGKDGMKATYEVFVDRVKHKLLDDAESASSFERSSNSDFVGDKPPSSVAYHRHVYERDPENLKEFSEWCLLFNIQDHTKEISDLLSEDHFLRSLHTTLIPEKVSYVTFWQRHFFQVHLAQEAEKKRDKLMARIDATEESNDTFDDWGDEEEDFDEEIENDTLSLADDKNEDSIENETTEPKVSSDISDKESNQTSSSTDQSQIDLKETDFNSKDEPKALNSMTSSIDSQVAEAMSDRLSTPSSDEDIDQPNANKSRTDRLYSWNDDDLDLDDDAAVVSSHLDTIQQENDAGDDDDDWEDWE